MCRRRRRKRRQRWKSRAKCALDLWKGCFKTESDARCELQYFSTMLLVQSHEGSLAVIKLVVIDGDSSIEDRHSIRT